MRYFTVRDSSIEKVTKKILQEYSGKAYIISLNKEIKKEKIKRPWYLFFLKDKEVDVILYKAYCGLPENNSEIQEINEQRNQTKKLSAVQHTENLNIDNDDSIKKEEKKDNQSLKAVSDQTENLSTQILQQELSDLKLIVNLLIKKQNNTIPKEQIEYFLQQDFSYQFAENLISSLPVSITSHKELRLILKEKLKLNIQIKNGIEFFPNTSYLFLGSTGVGKTTTLAKMAALCYQQDKKDFQFISFDSYRLGADEQLRKYAAVFGKSFHLVQDNEDMIKAIQNVSSHDILFLDTAGESLDKDLKLEETINYTQHIKQNLKYILVVSANTKTKDLYLIKKRFSHLKIDYYIITKIDETRSMGSILEFLYYEDIPAIYYTDGQEVPSNIKEMNLDYLLKDL